MSATTTTKRNTKSANSGKDQAMSATAVETRVIPIGDVSVELPNRFASMVGQEITPDLAKIIFAHVSGQFRNNQVANAKARAERYAKAETDAERAANAPLTADDYLAIWNGTNGNAPYMPNVGDTVRQSTMDKLRYEAAKRAWFKLVDDHNKAIAAGQPGILKSDKPVALAVRPVKTKAVSTEQHEKAVADWQDAQDALYAKILTVPAYQDRVQEQMDTLLAEQGKKKAEATAETADASADLL